MVLVPMQWLFDKVARTAITELVARKMRDIGTAELLEISYIKV